MPNQSEIDNWVKTVRDRYESYLETSFFFGDPALRESFRSALQSYDLLKGPFHEPKREFRAGATGWELAEEFFPGQSDDLKQALFNRVLYAHQERAVRATFAEELNVVVATGTASGKTESFLYPILFDLYRQHLDGQLQEPGVRAMVLYPMNALANDQRRRLGEICGQLEKGTSGFEPTFGQYIGQTPENRRDHRRNATEREEERLPGELVFREEMRANPPHILLTNYSMLEYLLIRPEDSPLFDHDKGRHWKFIVLDEAHQYRGARGMEMGMLVRRLKQRLREGGREGPFRCIATSATIASGEGEEDRRLVGEFAEQLFGEPFSTPGVVFGQHEPQVGKEAAPRRYHVFMRALEGAFLVHEAGKDNVVLNRKQGDTENGSAAQPLEIALCRECGQHYYVGREEAGHLVEASRDPSQTDFGVDYYLPIDPGEKGSHILCRICGRLSQASLDCMCGATIDVKKCESHKDNRDQLKMCETCGYRRGGIGDPVQEIVHGSDGPNAVIATALHELLPDGRRKVLAFADSRQEAAFFAWYAEDSYEKLRDRNLMLRALEDDQIDPEGLSLDDLRNRLSRQWAKAGMFSRADTAEGRALTVLTAILREAVTDERRLSLAGVGLAKWTVKLPESLALPQLMLAPPWNFTSDEAHQLVQYLMDSLRLRYALALPDDPAFPPWSEVSPERSQEAIAGTRPRGRRNVSEWGARESAVVQHFLHRLLADGELSGKEKTEAAVKLMKDLLRVVTEHDRRTQRENDQILVRANGVFRLNHRWLRIKLAKSGEMFECDTCASVAAHNIRYVCPRNRCPGSLVPADLNRLDRNHYRVLYRAGLPAEFRAEEHTAQIDSDEARRRQDQFKADLIHLLSSSTTFEIGVDLGDLEVVFLRNVPPEPFNYTQRAGRAGRREEAGLALTYCRRNPHDLYHYDDPERRVIQGAIQPPRLRMTNDKIILRHVAAAALSAFFRHPQNLHRFHNVNTLIGDWENPSAISDLKQFCEGNRTLEESLLQIVPPEMHDRIDLGDGGWVETIAGPDSRFAIAQAEACADYLRIQAEVSQLSQTPGAAGWKIGQLIDRRNTIANARTLEFLSRKAIIPKYGFPVDVVELDTRPRREDSNGVSLQRDLSQAIAEYAPGGKVVANKKEWVSVGVKTIPGKQFPVKSYSYDDARTFDQSDATDRFTRKYLQPAFGFVTPLFEKPKEPRRRPQRLYTTRPFFPGFPISDPPETEMLGSVRVTQAQPGSLVVLCEGKDRAGFYICQTCGRHMTNPQGAHKTPEESVCTGTLERFSLGHELVTDVVRIRFPSLTAEWDAYSLAYAILLGAADTMDVPDMDLNVTITAGDVPNEAAIVLYDNVPGGAGLVAELGDEYMFWRMLSAARERLGGTCGCDSSCYGCLRSYRNQFAHPYLDRKRAMSFLDDVLSQTTLNPAS